MSESMNVTGDMLASIRERVPGVYEVQVSVGRDPATGRWRYRSETVRLPATGRGKGWPRAVLAVADRMEAAKREARTPPTGRTLGQLLEAYVDHQERRGRAAKTIRGYRDLAQLVGRDPVAQVRVERLTGYDLDCYLARLADSGLSTVSRHHRYALISQALNQAINWRWIPPPNPAKAATVPANRAEERDPPSPAEVRRLALAAARPVEEGGNPDLATLVFVAATTGCRRGELCGLRWGDLQLDPAVGAARMALERRVSDMTGGPVLMPATKNRRKRGLALGPATVAVLLDQRVRVEARCAFAGVELTSDRYVWSQDPEHATPWRPQNVSNAFRRLRVREGLERVRLHDLRHFAATQLVASGTDLRTAAGRLGHDASVLARIYAAVLPANDVAAAAALDAIVGPLDG